jgi:hypothetical protein
MDRYYLLTIIPVYTSVETPLTFVVKEDEANKKFTIEDWENWYEQNYETITKIKVPYVFKQDAVIVNIVNVIIQA